MKKIVIIMAFAILTAVSFAGCGGDRTNTADIFSVSDVQDDPLAFTGEITITGVITEFARNNPAMFGIEYTARRPCCPAFILPVEYTGNEPIPALGDEVNVTGSWGEELETGVFVFTATRLEIRRAG